MSKIKDEIIAKYSKQIDNYKEHFCHLKYDKNCSECFKDKQEEVSEDMFGMNLELINNSYN